MAAFPWLCQLSSASWNDAVLASASLSVILPSSLSSVSMSFQKRALIGALICIGGNTLISLALNVQKLAHQKTKEQTDHEGEAAPSAQQSNPAGSYEEVEEVDANGEYRIDDSGNNSKQRYTARKSSSAGHSRSRTGSASYGQGGDDSQAEQQADSGPNTRFLKSKLWWLGFGLMVLGECGNFISYGFAPASLVAPLGSVALLANVFIAPVLVKERFAKSDLLGVALASLGAAGVVAASSTDGGGGELEGGPDALWEAIQQTIFVVYACVMAGVGVILAWLSVTRWGDRYILIDVGACAVFGGFTVLSTKGVSSLLSHAAGQRDFTDLLRSPLSYGLVVVLVATALVQIAFLNRALQRFDARSVIPSQFVFFTISAICGSAVLFRDFERASAGRVIGFMAGCLTTFAGVFVLTRRQDGESPDDQANEQGGSENGSQARPSVVVDEERQALLPVTPQKQKRPAGPIPTMTTGSVPQDVHGPSLASSSLPTTVHVSATTRTPRLSLVGGSAMGAGGYLLLATPAGASRAGGRAKSATPGSNRAPLSSSVSYSGVSAADDSTRRLSQQQSQDDLGRPLPSREAERSPSRLREQHNGSDVLEELPPLRSRKSKPSVPGEDLPAMPLNLPSHFTTAPPPPTSAQPAETSFRSQLSGFRWAQGPNNDSRPVAQQPRAGAANESSSFLPNWMSSYVPLHSSERSNEEEAFLSLSRWERFLGFLACLAGSGVCFLFSFLFLLSPIPKLRKFALSFSMGSVLFMVGFAILSGPVAHLRHILSAARLPFSVAYFGSLGLTLYFALGPRTTLPTLLAGVAQVVALVTYLAAYFPGGTTTLRYGGSMAARGLGNLLPI